jgi:predicted phage terminase large subunit-like protein
MFAMAASHGLWVPKPHLCLIDDLWLRAMTEPIHAIVEMPPRHGKSELGSHWGPAWAIGVYRKRVILTSYEAQFAATWGGKARDAVISNQDWLGVEVDQRTAARDAWNLIGAGGMVTAGVGGPITGKGADVLLVDDPVKNDREALSPKTRERMKEWWRSTAYTRLEPGGSAIVTMTRWHEDDLVGYLLREEGVIDEGGKWTRLRLPALAEPDDPLGRSEGEPLWPDRYGLDRLAELKVSSGPYWWNALYQQRPSPPEGGMLNRTWWRYWTDDPVTDADEWDAIIASWDMNFRGGPGSDYVVGQVWGRHQGRYYLLDQVRGPWNFPETIQAFTSLCERWPAITTHIVEKAANGEAVIASLRDHVPGIIGVPPVGSKEARVASVSGMIEAGQVYLPEPRREPWVADFIEECAAFPNALNDDQVDAMSQGLRRLAQSRVTKMRSILR